MFTFAHFFFRQKIFQRGVAVLLSFILGNTGVYAAEAQSATFFMTLTKPTPIEVQTPGSGDQPLLTPHTFLVQGVAEPQKYINLYSWAIIPGTEGNTDENKTITAFSGTASGSGSVKLTWQPRRIFRQDELTRKLQDGPTCSALKTKCLSADHRSVEAAPTSGICVNGNVPSSIDCTLPGKFSVFNAIARPSAAKSNAPAGQISLGLPAPLTEADLGRTLNNTLFSGPKCQSGLQCEYDPYPIGWITTLAPLGQLVALLKTDLTAVLLHSLNVDEVNGLIPTLDGPGNPWRTDIFDSGTYLPNITTNGYSGAYVFSFWNFVRAFNANVTGDPTANPPETYEASGFFPLKDFTVLVDDFRQYEIYTLEDSQYPLQEGVTRENGQLVKIIRDPSISEITIDYAAAHLDPSKTYHFAIFEVRDSDALRLPAKLTDPLLQKTVNASDCTGDPTAPTSCTPVIGHLISASNEVTVTGSTTQSVPSPLKREWQIFEQEGSYTGDPLKTDRNGELKCGVNQNEDCLFAKSRINPFASYYFFVGTYTGDATPVNSGNGNSFSVRTNRLAGDIFNLTTLIGKTSSFAPTDPLYGVVFNSWTNEILGNVTVNLQGQTAERGETVRASQKTGSDGLFSFSAAAGSYSVNVAALQNTTSTFVFPSTNFSLQNTDPQNPDCGDSALFPHVICQKDQLITLKDAAQNRNIALDPPLKGTVNGTTAPVKVVLMKNGTAVASTWTLPDGKFSFFLSPGTYEIAHVEDQQGGVLLKPQQSVTVSADSTGQLQGLAPLSFSL